MMYKDLPVLTKEAAYQWYLSLGWPNGIDDIYGLDMPAIEWLELIDEVCYYDHSHGGLVNAKLVTDELMKEFLPYIMGNDNG